MAHLSLPPLSARCQIWPHFSNSSDSVQTTVVSGLGLSFEVTPAEEVVGYFGDYSESTISLFADYGKYEEGAFIFLDADFTATILPTVAGSSSSSTGAAPPSSQPSSSSTGSSSVLGDPQFVGLLGQSFQVHGIDGAVYSLLRDSTGLMVNARFVFLSGGECPPAAAISTACWSHPGSYLGEVALVTAEGAQLSVASGKAAAGFSSVTLDGQAVAVGANISLPGLFVHYLTTHSLTLDAGNYALTLHNSDAFVNIQQLAVKRWSLLRERRTHGLLGQTWQAPSRRGADVREVEGSVDDYAEGANELFGSDFTHFAAEET